MNGVVGDRDDLFLDLDVVDFIVEVEDDFLGIGGLSFFLKFNIDPAVIDLDQARSDDFISGGNIGQSIGVDFRSIDINNDFILNRAVFCGNIVIDANYSFHENSNNTILNGHRIRLTIHQPKRFRLFRQLNTA